MNTVLEAREPSARYLVALESPLLQQFDLIASAPKGVARLRELILTLAVQGKLVPQDPNDEPTSELLKGIGSSRHDLKTKPIIPLDTQDCPFNIPSSWQWVRFDSLFSLEYGDNLPAPKRSNTGEFPVYGSNGVVGSHSECSVCGPCIIVGRKGSAGALNLCLEPGCWVTDVAYYCVPPKELDLHFCFKLFHTLGLDDLGKGIKPGLSRSEAYVIPVAIPPLAEQSRIVARVEQLMAVCDALEAKRKLEAEQHARLVGSLFDSLANSESAHALAENWQRIATHFDLLLDRPAAVDALEQTILQLAVRGLLVPQDPADEPASALLQKIRAEKDRLIATGQLKRDKPLPPTSNEEIPVELPEGWGFVSFPELCVIGGGATPSKAKPTYWEGDLPWVSPKDMKVDFISDAQDHVSKLALEETRLPLVPKSSLLIVVRGMILAHSFPVGVTQVEVTINQDMKSLTPLYPALTPYLALVCKGFKQEILELVERSSHGTCKLESDKLFAFRFGLPPLAEQSRIVARVTDLRALCAQLRERLATTSQTQSRLAATLIEKAVA